MFMIDDSYDNIAARLAIEALRNGDVLRLRMYSDDFIRQHVSAEDYEFWLAKKSLHAPSDSITCSRADD